ncbi:MAG: FAD-dependent oxidoreductase [Armatimonadetes bacterium]|nr:FAD-dependent oxidoreductase [Armatimonadota bacterium]
MRDGYGIVVIGAGSGGLAAAQLAAALGMKTALVDKHRIGGDCTWTGCVPSKALLHAAKVAAAARSAGQFGIETGPVRADMAAVREYVQSTIQTIYAHEAPDKLRTKGIDVFLGGAEFADPHTIRVQDRTIRGRRFLLTTGARPFVPPIPGLDQVTYLTYEQLFENDRLPEHLIVLGGGPIGMEMSQAFRRFGADVTVIGSCLLPHDEPEAGATLQRVFEREGTRVEFGRATAVRQDGGEIVVTVEDREVRGDMLLVAVGRRPNVDGLGLERAGVKHSPHGIEVDKHLRTSQRHILAAGDCIGKYQFTHYAGWQAVRALMNSILPFGGSNGLTELVPWTTFTEPEVAHVGLTEAQARERGADVAVTSIGLDVIDRAVCENDTEGFIKLVHTRKGKLLGATVVSERAGEVLTEYTVALQNGLSLGQLTAAIHVYPTYATGASRAAVEVMSGNWLSGRKGEVVRKLVARLT